MSLQHMAWAMRQEDISGLAKYVLIILADHTNNQTGLCFPSLTRIAKVSGLSQATIKRRLIELEEKGLIARQRQHDGAEFKATRYVLRYSETGGDKQRQGVGSERADLGSHRADPGSERATNQEYNHTGLSKDKPYVSSERFDRLWKSWPITGRKRSANKAVCLQKLNAAVAKHGEDVVQRGFRNFLDSDEPHRDHGHYCPGLHVFLNSERYLTWAEDED